MEFYIRQSSTEPPLKLELIDNGKNNKTLFNDLLENSLITFEMFNTNTSDFQILNAECTLEVKVNVLNQLSEDYLIVYRFTELDTSVKGRYEGKVTVQFLDTDLNPTSKLIVPIKERLYINII